MFDTIFQPSDFSETSKRAFYHALKIALSARSDLRLMHVAPKGEHGHGRQFPRVRRVLEDWGVLENDSQRKDVTRLGLEVIKTIIHDDDPGSAIAKFLDERPASLIVLAAHDHGHSLWSKHSTAEPIARHAATTTLFMPDKAKGFVSEDSGDVSLQNIVIPVVADPSPHTTLDSVHRLVMLLGIESVKLHFVHVGTLNTLPQIPHSSTPAIEHQMHLMSGDPVASIVGKTREVQADLVAMTTDGHHGFLDALRGNTTEQVLRRLQCPLWAVDSRGLEL